MTVAEHEPAPERDLYVLIRDFEQFVHHASRVPLTGKVILDEDDVYSFLDHLRRLVPEEIDRARRLLADRDRLLEQARAEAEAMVKQASGYVERMARDSEITRKAEEQARRLLAQAEARSREVRASANAYAADVLDRLEGILRKALATVSEGRQELQAILRAAGAAPGQAAAAAREAASAQDDEPGPGGPGSEPWEAEDAD
ncbi:ATP synthase subunit B family protein [Thermaerobacter litoralis]